MQDTILPLLALLGKSFEIFQFDSLVVFGDSVSDDGFDVSYDTHGFKRFCSGPNWAEYLERYLGIAKTENYAYSGARSDYGNWSPYNWSGGLWQLEKFLEEHGNHVSEKTLIAIQTMGINDIWMEEKNMTLIAENFYFVASQLAKYGAKNMLIYNIMDFGIVPGVKNDTEFGAKMNQLVKSLNKQLAQRIDRLKTEFPTTNFYPIDVENLFFNLEKAGSLKMDPPFDHHLNTTYFKAGFEYAFYDTYHPSTVVHSYMALEAYRALTWRINGVRGAGPPNLALTPSKSEMAAVGGLKPEDVDTIRTLLIVIAVVMGILAILLSALLITLCYKIFSKNRTSVGDITLKQCSTF